LIRGIEVIALEANETVKLVLDQEFDAYLKMMRNPVRWVKSGEAVLGDINMETILLVDPVLSGIDGYAVLAHLERNKIKPRAVGMISSKPLQDDEIEAMKKLTGDIYKGDVTYLPIPKEPQEMKNWAHKVAGWVESNI